MSFIVVNISMERNYPTRPIHYIHACLQNEYIYIHKTRFLSDACIVNNIDAALYMRFSPLCMHL